MFGKLSSNQKKALRNILLESSLVNTVASRLQLLVVAELDYLKNYLHLDAENNLFAFELVQECEQRGLNPEHTQYSTVLLALYLRDEDSHVSANPDVHSTLDEIIAVYKPDLVRGREMDTGGTFGTPAGILRVLFLASNPAGTGQLCLKEELETVRDALQRRQMSNPGLKVVLEPQENVTDRDIIDIVQEFKPHILHFAGHGTRIRTGETSATRDTSNWRGLFIVDENDRPVKDLDDNHHPSGIVLATDRNRARLLPDSVLVKIALLPEIRRNLRLVVLNACWAAGQADSLVKDGLVPFTIGMSEEINDLAAVRFAEGFYRALFDPGFSLQSAYEVGKNQIVAVMGNRHDHVPYLKIRADLRREDYFIFKHL